MVLNVAVGFKKAEGGRPTPRPSLQRGAQCRGHRPAGPRLPPPAPPRGMAQPRPGLLKPCTRELSCFFGSFLRLQQHVKLTVNQCACFSLVNLSFVMVPQP